MYKGTFIIASGPVIIEDGKLLVNKDSKDDFYKIPGGTVKEGIEDLEEACHRKVKEEINGEIEIIKSLSPKILWKNPTTKERMAILLVSYLARLKNKEEIAKKGVNTNSDNSFFIRAKVQKFMRNIKRKKSD